MRKGVVLVLILLFLAGWHAFAASQAETAVADDTGPVELTVFFQAGRDPGPATFGFLDAIEEATGVRLALEVAPETNYLEKLQLLLVSGDMPDVAMFPRANDIYKNAALSEVIIPINDYLDSAPNFMKYTYDVSWDNLRIMGDERIFGMPRSTIMRNDGYYIREDWLNNVGLEIPEDHAFSLDEFEEVLRRFTEEDPDQNGKDDTFGMLATVTKDKVFMPMLTDQFGVLGWQKVAGEDHPYMNLQYSRTSPAYKEALAFTAKLFKAGYLNPAGLTGPANAVEDFHRGTSGMSRGFSGYYIRPHGEAQLKPNFPDARSNYLFVENAGGEVVGSTFSTGLVGVWAITSSSEHPRRAVEAFDWMISDDGFGYQLEVFEDREGNFTRTFARRNEFRTVLGPYDGPRWDKERLEEMQFVIDIAMSSLRPSESRGFIPTASTRPGYVSYQRTYNEVVTKISLGELPVSDYDALLDGWYENGGEEYVREMNEFIMATKEEM